MSEETWRAVHGILEDPARKPPRGVRALLGGVALCPCSNVVTGMPNHVTQRIHRCQPPTRNRAWADGQVARQAEPVEDFIEKLIIARLSRDDAADLVAIPKGGPDVGALREESTAIRANLEEMAADRALGLITRAQMLAATGPENVLAPLVAAENATAVWKDLDRPGAALDAASMTSHSQH